MDFINDVFDSVSCVWGVVYLFVGAYLVLKNSAAKSRRRFGSSEPAPRISARDRLGELQKESTQANVQEETQESIQSTDSKAWLMKYLWIAPLWLAIFFLPDYIGDSSNFTSHSNYETANIMMCVFGPIAILFAAVSAILVLIDILWLLKALVEKMRAE